MSGMIGVILGFGTSLTVIALGVRTLRNLTDPNECKLIETYLKNGGNSQNEAFRQSRPGILVTEIASVRQKPELAVAAFNDALADVDSSTRAGQHSAKLLARASLMAGTAGACAELAVNAHAPAITAACWGLAAILAGLGGFVSCTVIGRRASDGLARRRRLWDEFVQWILNSQFSRSELNVPGNGELGLSGVRNAHRSRLM